MASCSTADQKHRGGVTLPSLPEPGQVVEVRGSTWAATDVVVQGLSRSPADEATASPPVLQHEVNLQSLDEDRMGEELRVIWELEVGHTVLPDQGLPEEITPEGFDDPRAVGALVDAVRWGAVTSADPKRFQSPFRAGVTLEPYQLEPLRRALAAPRTNLLLADDVGLGKTIEAGLVVEELLLRHRARSVIIVCPPSLSLKWREEMRDKFGLDFIIVNAAALAETRRTHGLAANPFRLYPRIIVSMAWLPRVTAQRLLRDVLAEARRSASARRYAFDVLVVDEAHHAAPAAPTATAQGRGYAVDSRRTIALRRLAEHCEHRLFLSATPHNGYTESFTALLEMIDSRRFSRGAEIDRSALAEVAVRRLKTQITGSRAFHERVLQTLPFTPAAEEEARFALLDAMLKDSARERGQKRLSIAALLLKKRFLSSPWAFARTMSRYLETSVGNREWVEDDSYYAEIMGSGQSDEEEGLDEQPEFEALRAAKADDPLAAAKESQVEDLIAWAQGFQHRPNSRLEALINFLAAVCRPDGRTWTNERVVVFTEYADTVEWLVEVLRSRGYDERRLGVIQGSTQREQREALRFAFTEDPSKEPIRVLVATDAAGEGIDLQDHCHRLINFDVPFNPSRLEQRIGRIDRYGQAHPPEIFSFIPVASPSSTSGSSAMAALPGLADTGRPGSSGGSALLSGDLEFVGRLVEKVATTRSDLGAVNPLVDTEASRRFLGASFGRATARSADEEAVNKVMAGSVSMNRQLTELARTYEARREELHLSPGACRRVVDEALRLTRQPLLIEDGDERTDAPLFRIPRLAPAWQGALAGLDTVNAPGQWRPITFTELDGADRERLGRDVVPIHLGHALMQKAARVLRSSVLSSEHALNRVTAVVVPDWETTCVASVARLVLVGRGGLRLHEEVFVTGLRLRGQNLAEEKVHDLLDRVLDGDDLLAADAPVREQLARAWMQEGTRMRERLTTEMGRRAERQADRVKDQLASRCQDDTDRARQIFAAFRRNLQDSLRAVRESQDDGQDALFTLVTDEQRRQRARDIRAMEERLDALDEEETREVDGIQERYRDIRPYVSQVALVFAVSGKDAEQWQQAADLTHSGGEGTSDAGEVSNTGADSNASDTGDTAEASDTGNVGDAAGHSAADDSQEAGA